MRAAYIVYLVQQNRILLKTLVHDLIIKIFEATMMRLEKKVWLSE